jgi:hypothetical protein
MTPFESWLLYRQRYLDELLMQDALTLDEKDGLPRCEECESYLSSDQTKPYRCSDCSLTPLLCESCLTSSHTRLPFHRIEVFLFIYVHFDYKLITFVDVEWEILVLYIFV